MSQQGVIALRQLSGVDATKAMRALELERLEQWQAALLEYTTMPRSRLTNFGSSGESEQLSCDTDGTRDAHRGPANESLGSESTVDLLAVCGTQRCLMELGYLDLVLDQVS